MPGLLRGIARTAVVAGTATAVSNRVSRRQGGRWAAQDAQEAQAALAAQARYAPAQSAPPQSAPPQDGTGSVLGQLRELDDLRRRGVLTTAEFEAQKAVILRY